METQGERKIPNASAAWMAGAALSIDLIQAGLDFVPIAGMAANLVIEAAAAITFSIWLGEYGVNLWSSKNVGGTLLTLAIDALDIPFTGTAWVVRIGSVAFSEREDQPGNSGSNTTPMWRI